MQSLTRMLLLRTRQDVAESIGIGNLSDDISSALAADVEYRLREVIEVGLQGSVHIPDCGLSPAVIFVRAGVSQVHASWQADAVEGRGCQLCPQGPEHRGA